MEVKILDDRRTARIIDDHSRPRQRLLENGSSKQVTFKLVSRDFSLARLNLAQRSKALAVDVQLFRCKRTQTVENSPRSKPMDSELRSPERWCWMRSKNVNGGAGWMIVDAQRFWALLIFSATAAS